MKMETLEDLFIHELQDLASAEKQLIAALPEIANAVTNEELRTAIEEHLLQTEEQLVRLEQIAADLNISLRGVKCAAMEGLLQEACEFLDMDMHDDVRDAALICSVQRIEHYEIAAYGCARTFAEQLGHSQAAHLLEQTLEEEKAADELLSVVAMGGINEEAAE